MKLKGVQMNIEIPEGELERLLQDEKFLTPIEAGFAAPYATEIEYGTGPGTVTPYDELDAWARRKLKMTDDGERARFVKNVIAKHYRVGKPPNPFFQPAVREVAMNAKRYDLTEGIYVLGEAIISEAQRRIEDEGITDQGGLITSGYVRRARL